MTDQVNPLVQFSDALAGRVEATKPVVVAIHLAHQRHITGIVWRPDIVVASAQSLPTRDEFEVVAAGGSVITAKAAGRDPATNIAILRLPTPIASVSFATGEAGAGAIAIAIGADGIGGASARLGIVNIAGPQWHSSRGGLIHGGILLDIAPPRRQEGGPG